MAKSDKHDGAIFGRTESVPDDPAHPEPQPHHPPRDDAAEWARSIADEVDGWLDSEQSTAASTETHKTARRLKSHCRTVIRAAESNGERQKPLGLRIKLTPAALIELGYLHCQFRVQAAGFERFAGWGKASNRILSERNQGAPMPPEAAKMFAEGVSHRKVADRCDVSRRTAERWLREWSEKKS